MQLSLVVTVLCGAIACVVTESCFEDGKAYTGDSVGLVKGIATADLCQQKCQQNDQCDTWTLRGNRCTLRKGKGTPRMNKKAISGPKNCLERKKLEETCLVVPLCDYDKENDEICALFQESCKSVFFDYTKEYAKGSNIMIDTFEPWCLAGVHELMFKKFCSSLLRNPKTLPVLKDQLSQSTAATLLPIKSDEDQITYNQEITGICTAVLSEMKGPCEV